MSLVVLESLSLAFGGRRIVEGLNLRVGETDRIGLVGRNGSGKSSLLRLIQGELEPDSGAIRRSGGLRIGYLPQELEVRGGTTVRSRVLSSVPGRGELEAELESLEAQLESTEDADEQMAVATKMADLHEALLHFDTAYSPHEAYRILAGLGFRESDYDRDLAELSGGWQMRAVLASLLFQKPDLLMLDEPTNHLDVPSVTWLADFLKKTHSAFILICHDREFLNEQVNRIVAYEPEGVRQYLGDYAAYKTARAEEVAILERRSKNVAREREAAERFIRRFRAQATKARAVQSRLKALERMEEVVTLEDSQSLKFRFPPCQRAGQEVIKLERIGHSYGAQKVFGGVSLTVRRGERVAIVGSNGAGKTTLLRIMAGNLEPSEGHVTPGHNVKLGYYAQHVADRLPLDSSILDEVWRCSVLDDVSATRAVLGTFFFSGDEVEKRIGVLSGGEKARVALACLLVDPGNVLLMDEPTNHLDLESAEALAEALETYDGTLVFVSHNRSFVNHLATRIWDIADGVVEEYPGRLDEYMARCRALETERERNAEHAGDGDRGAANERSGKRRAGAKGARSAPAQRPRRREPKPVRGKSGKSNEARRVAEYEKRIADLEERQAVRSKELSRPEIYQDQSRYQELLAAFTQDQRKLDELLQRWERAQANFDAEQE